MKQVSINEIGFILHLHRLFVNTRMPWYVFQKMRDKLVTNKTYIHDVGIDMPEIAEWKWTGIK